MQKPRLMSDALGEYIESQYKTWHVALEQIKVLEAKVNVFSSALLFMATKYGRNHELDRGDYPDMLPYNLHVTLSPVDGETVFLNIEWDFPELEDVENE